MSTVYNFDGYSDFCDWCEQNDYDPDTQYDLESENHKRSTFDTFYIKKIDSDVYAQVSVETDYDNGWGYGEILREGLTRKVEQVVTEKVSYV
jgi:hypothetical protein